MWGIFRIAAAVATLALVPAASPGFSLDRAVAPATAAALQAATAAPKAAPADEFGLETAHVHDHAPDLAPGQGAREFRDWLSQSPAHRSRLEAFRTHLAAEGVEGVVPLWQLVRTSSSWRE